MPWCDLFSVAAIAGAFVQLGGLLWAIVGFVAAYRLIERESLLRDIAQDLKDVLTAPPPVTVNDEITTSDDAAASPVTVEEHLRDLGVQLYRVRSDLAAERVARRLIEERLSNVEPRLSDAQERLTRLWNGLVGHDGAALRQSFYGLIVAVVGLALSIPALFC